MGMKRLPVWAKNALVLQLVLAPGLRANKPGLESGSDSNKACETPDVFTL